MRMALLSKNKLLFIDEGIPNPQRTDAIFLVWERCTNLVLSCSLKSLNTYLLLNLSYGLI